eukprot:CAMPEP_0178698362 /NCGR_PEP_ID=MMETSP0699-20121125/10489_1 /TAXON_ID=265572 /ORGANISM="Extubocellulus spinifer, Strain CCMP396" /LENGTH=338 /DNA_ID=CAMNT_0020344403 /DNA_START=1025 /DNA_END=2041 /DNA_ORIENTATION=-
MACRSYSLENDECTKPTATPDVGNEPEELSEEAKQKKRIETLEKARDEQDQTLTAVLTEMVDHRADAEEMKTRHKLEVDRLNRENEHLKKRLELMRTSRDMDDKLALHEYAKIIQQQTPDVTDTAYIMRLKSQLIKSVQQIGILSDQLSLVNEENETEVKDLHKQIVEAQNARTKAEMEFMNDLFVMERQCNEVKEDYEAKLTSQQELIAQLQIELDLEREMKSDAMSYARHMKDKESMDNSSTTSIDLLEAHADSLARDVREKEKAEARLKAELQAKMKEVQDLQDTCSNQEKSMAKLRADLKTLSHERSHYEQLPKRDDVEADAKRKARSVSARGA